MQRQSSATKLRTAAACAAHRPSAGSVRYRHVRWLVRDRVLRYAAEAQILPKMHLPPFKSFACRCAAGPAYKLTDDRVLDAKLQRTRLCCCDAGTSSVARLKLEASLICRSCSILGLTTLPVAPNLSVLLMAMPVVARRGQDTTAACAAKSLTIAPCVSGVRRSRAHLAVFGQNMSAFIHA